VCNCYDGSIASVYFRRKFLVILHLYKDLRYWAESTKLTIHRDTTERRNTRSQVFRQSHLRIEYDRAFFFFLRRSLMLQADMRNNLFRCLLRHLSMHQRTAPGILFIWAVRDAIHQCLRIILNSDS
jgi:hypothetical protein